MLKKDILTFDIENNKIDDSGNAFAIDDEDFFCKLQRLKPKQQHALIKMLEGVKNVDIAKELDINNSTIYTWLGEELFSFCLTKLQSKVINYSLNNIFRLGNKALLKLEDIIDDENTSSIVKVKAIEVIMKSFYPLVFEK